MGSSNFSEAPKNDNDLAADIAEAAAEGSDDSDAEASCPCPKWKYEIGANLLGEALGRSYYHLFVRVTDMLSLATPTYRAGPSKSPTQSPSFSPIVMGGLTPDATVTPNENYEVPENDDGSSYGYIVSSYWSDFRQSVENTGYQIFGAAVELDMDHNPALTRHSHTIDAKKIEYAPTGPNSNSFATTIVNEESIGAKPPDVWAPGQGIDLI